MNNVFLGFITFKYGKLVFEYLFLNVSTRK